MGMVRRALDDDRILGGIIAMLLLAGVALVVGFVSWTSNAERPSLAVVEQVESVEASSTPSPREPVDGEHADAPRGRGFPPF